MLVLTDHGAPGQGVMSGLGNMGPHGIEQLRNSNLHRVALTQDTIPP